MSTVIQLGIIGLLICVNAFFAAAEIAVVTVNGVRMRTLAEQGDRRARLVEKITANSTQFLATLQVGITLAGFFTSATAASQLSLPLAIGLAPWLGPAAQSISLVVVTLLIAFVSLILGELVPKRLGLRYGEAIALFSVGPIYRLGQLARPVVKFLTFVTNGLLRLMGNAALEEETAVNVEEIKALVDAARIGGTVGQQEQRIIYGAVELRQLTARAIMVPRVQMQYVQTDMSLREAVQIVSETAHTRLPVCEQNLDRVVGVLHVKDMVRFESAGGQQPLVRELMRPVRFVTETKPVPDLLREMKLNRSHLVIVRDEFGGTAGLVTLEDVLEEIVGEIRDEYDAAEEREFHRLGTHSGIFKLRASIATVNNELNIRLPRHGAATLAGLFLKERQRSPKSGDRMEVNQVSLYVLEDGQRVQVSLIQTPKPKLE